MTLLVQDVLKKGQLKLEESGISTIDARLLLEWVLKMNFTQLINNYHTPVEPLDEQQYYDCIRKRINHVPLQYIVNSQNFYGHDFFVDERVLIPRPETELLVETVIDHVENLFTSGKKEIRILDLCTGSGCIILSISKHFEAWLAKNKSKSLLSCFATDISMEALQVAQINEVNLLKIIPTENPTENQTENPTENLMGNKINWIQGDLFDALKDIVPMNGEPVKFDIIVSNPPYISPDEIKTLAVEVQVFEPMNALDGGVDGMEFYKSIIAEAPSWLKTGGKIFFEIGHGQMEATKELLYNGCFSEVKGMYDYYEHERIVHGVFLRES